MSSYAWRLRIQAERDAIEIENPEAGFSFWPFTQRELELIRGYFDLADELLNKTEPYDPSHLWSDTDEIKVLRFKMSEFLNVMGKFPVLADTNAHSNNYDPLLQPEEYFKWLTVADIKQHMAADVPATELKDSSGNNLPDDFPVLVLPPRKYGGFGGVVFYHDDWPDSDNWAMYVTKAKDFIADNPQYAAWLVENGGYVSDTDLIFQIHLTRKHFLDSQFVINFIVKLINAQFNLNWYNFNFNFVFNPPPPPGGWPPGIKPPDTGIIPPANVDSDHDFNFDCNITGIDEFHGTNSTGLPSVFDATLLPADFGVDYLDLQHYNLKPDIESVAKFRTGIQDASRFEEIEICYTYYFTDSMTLQLPFLGTDLLKSEPPHVSITRLGFQASYDAQLAPDHMDTFPVFKMPLVIPPATLPDAIDVQARIAVAEDRNILFSHWQEIDGIYLDGKLLPADYSDTNNPWDNTFASPIIRFALKRVRTTADTWRGVGVPTDVDSPCLTNNILTGFLQDYAQWDWKNATGDTQVLFTGNDWAAGIDAVLFETYVPNPSGSIWLSPSGSGAQGVMDAWRNANPNFFYDQNNNLVIFNEDYQVNRICYIWMKVPPGETFFACNIFPNPIDCWIKLVAYHKTDGSIVIQDAAHRCNTVNYPDYPGYYR